MLRREGERFPRLRDGDELTPRHLNVIYAALEYLLGFVVSGLGRNDEHGFVAVTSGTITAASGTTLGRGTARLWKLERSGDNVVRTDTGKDVTVFNTNTATVASGRVVQLKRANGFLLIDVDNC